MKTQKKSWAILKQLFMKHLNDRNLVTCSFKKLSVRISFKALEGYIEKLTDVLK